MFDPEDIEDTATMKEMYDMYISLCTLFIDGQGKSPLEVAAVLQCIATSIYKSSLKPKDFEKVMKHMYDSRNLITADGYEHMGPRPPNEMLH